MVIAIVAIIFATAGTRVQSAKQQAVDEVRLVGVLNIGLRADIGSLCTFNTYTGEYEGLEKDVIDEVIYRLFGNDILVTFVEVNSRTKDALIIAGEIDIALGASINTNSNKINYTRSFYSDGSAFLVLEETMVSETELVGKTIAIVQDSYVAIENDDEVTKLEEYLTSRNISAELKMYASYPEAVDALEGGHVDAICANEIYLKLFGKKGMLIIPERFLAHRYSIETRSELETLSNAMSDIIEEMQADGTMYALIEKWNLIDYDMLEQ